MKIETADPSPSDTPPSDTGRSVLTLYLREIGPVRRLSREEEATLAMRIQGGDEAAREQMIKANLRLVVAIAHDLDYGWLPLLDLISEGNMGLMRAVDRFDPGKGVRLATYASIWIRAYMYRALSQHARTVRIPENAVHSLHLIHAATNQLQERLGRDPTNDEIADETGLPPARVQRILEAAQPTTPLDAPHNCSEQDAFVEPEVEDETFAEPVTMKQLQDFLAQLSPREQAILRFRFGLAGTEERTLNQLGQQFGLTGERVRQIQQGALLKLRKKFNAQNLLLLAARRATCPSSSF